MGGYADSLPSHSLRLHRTPVSVRHLQLPAPAHRAPYVRHRAEGAQPLHGSGREQLRCSVAGRLFW